MALRATIYKADLQIADMDRHYYADHALTLARHPSETDERMMVRVLVYALAAGEEEKHRVAALLVTRGFAEGCFAVSTQVMLELFVTVTRKLAAPLSHANA